MSIFHDPYAPNYRLLSRSYDTSHPIFKAPLKTSIISQESQIIGDKDDGLVRQNSKGMIKLGAKIKSVKDGSQYSSNCKLGNRLDNSVSQIFSEQMKQSMNQSTTDKYQKEYSPNVKLAFKRIDSTEVASTKTDSPRVSTFLQSTNKFISAKLSTVDNSRVIEPDMRRIHLEPEPNFSKQKLQHVIQQKSAEINYLTRQLAEEKRNSQNKIRQLELEIQMLNYTHQQTLSSVNYKVQTLKKEITTKDSLISEHSKELRQLRELKNNHLIEISKIKQECRKGIQEWKQKYSQIEADMRYLNIKHTLVIQQKNKLQSNIRNLNNKLLTTSKSTDQNIRPYGSLPRKNSINLTSTSYHSNSPQPSRVVQVSKKTIILNKSEEKQKQQQILSLKKSVESKNRVIYNLSEEKTKLEQKIELLNTLIDENNEERMKEKLQRVNEEFRYKY